MKQKIKRSNLLKKTKYVTMLGYKWLPDINISYYNEISKQMANSVDNSIRDLLLGTPTGKYRNKKVKKYLHIPYPVLKWQEEDYSDDGYVDEGLLLLLSWWKSPIVIGTEVIKVPVYRKPKGTIKFIRHGELKPVKIKHGKRKTIRRKEKG